MKLSPRLFVRLLHPVLPACLMACCLAGGAAAQTVLEIAGGSNVPWRIAVVPFAWETRALRTFDPAQLVEQDLMRYSGFEVVEREQMLSFPVSAEGIVRWDWLAQGADFVLTARVREHESADLSVWIEWSLYDVSQGRVVLSATEPDEVGSFRRMLHRISDRIHTYVLGVPGINSTRFVYVSLVPKVWGQPLYRLIQADADGKRQRTLFSSNDPILAPAWSPDGRQIAFATFSEDRLRIQIFDLATGRVRYLGPWGGNASEPAFSPRGDHLALTLSRDTNPDIYIYHLRSGKMTRLTRHFAIDAEPVWSPDGGSILFTSDRSGTAQIYRMNLLSGEIRRLTFSSGNDGRSRVLPDGRRVVFVRNLGNSSYIALLDLQTLAVKTLTEAGLQDSPGVAPDGNTVLYSSSAGKGNYFSGIQISGSGRFRLENLGAGVRAPSWSPVYR